MNKYDVIESLASNPDFILSTQMNIVAYSFVLMMLIKHVSRVDI